MWFFIATDEANESDIRYQAAKHNNVSIIPYTKFLDKVGITNEELDSMNPLLNMVKRVQKNKWIENKIFMIKEKNNSKEGVSSSLGGICLLIFLKD